LSENGEQILQEILESQEVEEALDSFAKAVSKNSEVEVNVPPTQEGPEPDKQAKENHTQWALGGNGRFMPVGATAPKLPSGIYEPFAVPGMWGLEKLSIASDGIYQLPDMATETVLDEVRKFWDSEHKYRTHKLLYKRGIILWGPPGGGKTVTVKLLMNELVKRDGIVIVAGPINLTVLCLKAVRRIEPNRNLIVVLEDIDEIINYNGEAQVLSMLDGENNVDNILHLATTNYPERLGARIINRPSRFDRRVYVGLPSAEARQAYLTQVTHNDVTGEELARWIDDTSEMSIAHMRELVAAVHCLGQPYDEVITRLKDMAKQVRAEEEFKKNKVGFNRARQIAQPFQ
jgi:hypothetical protein